MNLVSNQQKSIQPVNSAQLVGIFQAIAPRSFEKTFEGIPTEQINHAMKICIDGLTRDQINTGLAMVRDNGFCPDPAMFRKWCLGIVGFGTEQQRAIESFKGKHAALADIIKWLQDDKHPLTNAEKEAYNRCYELFNQMQYANNFERASYLAYDAFKDNYRDVVAEMVEKGEQQAIWISPVAVQAPSKPILAAKSKFPEPSPEEKRKIEELTAKYQAQGLSFPKALLKAHSELNGLNLGKLVSGVGVV
ncbi:hypothetical protein ACX1N5_04020 [Acinetobacter sp. ANC 4636]